MSEKLNFYAKLEPITSLSVFAWIFRFFNFYSLLSGAYIIIIIPAKARDYGITGVGLSVCLSVFLFVTTITK